MLKFFVTVLLTVFFTLTPLLFHEMGHWAALHRFKVGIREYWLGLGPMVFRFRHIRVGMFPIGGALVPDPDRYAALTPAQRTIVALAGPLASLIYGVVILCVWAVNPHLFGIKALWSIAMLNFVLAGVNALPIPPLDGFQALSNWMAHRQRPLSQATLSRAYRIGNGLVYGVGFFVLGLTLFKSW